MSGIYQKQVNSGSVANPSAGNTLISVNESGELFTKDSSGAITVYGSGSGGGGGGTGSIDTGSFATTGSNSFLGDQNITGSVYISGSSPLTFSVGSVFSVSNPTGSMQFTGSMNISGSISSSGTISMLTASIGGGIFTSASLAAGGGGGGSTESVTKSFPADESIDDGRAVSVGDDGAVSNTIVQQAEYVLATELGGMGETSIEATSIGDNKHIIAFYDTQMNNLWVEAYTIDGNTVITGSRLGIGDVWLDPMWSGADTNYVYNISSHQSDKALLQYYDTAHVSLGAMFPTTASFMVLNVDGSNTITTSSRQLISGSIAGSGLQAVNDNEFIFLGFDTSTMNAGATVINADNSDIITPAGAYGTISTLPQSGSGMLSPAGIFNMAKYDTNKAIAGLVRQDSMGSPSYYIANGQTLEVSASVVNAYSQSYASLGDTYDPMNDTVNLQVSAVSSSAGRYGAAYLQNMMSSLSQLALIGISSSLSGSQTVDVFNYLDSNTFITDINGGDGIMRGIHAIPDIDTDDPNIVAVGLDASIYTFSPDGGGSANEKMTTVDDSILGLRNAVSLPDININTTSSLAIVNYDSNSMKFTGATAVASSDGFQVQGTNNMVGLVGLAAESSTSGSNVSVTIAGVNSSQTGLTPGSIYLLQEDGTLEAYEDSIMESGVQIGTAISSTEIIFNPIYSVTGM